MFIANIAIIVLILSSFGVFGLGSYGEEIFYSAQLLWETLQAAWAALQHYIAVLRS